MFITRKYKTQFQFQCIRASASASGSHILSYFTIPKNYFINYTIPFHNTPNIPKLYYFTILLKYYFLIFLYYYFSNRHFFCKFNYSSLFKFNYSSFLPQPLAPANQPNAGHQTQKPATTKNKQSPPRHHYLRPNKIPPEPKNLK